jgi:hypothetical protein
MKDIINKTVQGNEIDPKLWYPKGHMPDLVQEWPLSKDIEIPNPFAGAGKD